MDPCRLCRRECMSTGGGCCKDCLITVILDTKRNIYPISVKDLEKKWKRE